jgi:hypothetical protein
MGIYGDLAGRSGTVDDLKEIRHGDGSGNLHEESTGIGDYNGDIFGLWNMNIFFPYIGNVIIPTDELHHFSEG